MQPQPRQHSENQPPQRRRAPGATSNSPSRPPSSSRSHSSGDRIPLSQSMPTNSRPHLDPSSRRRTRSRSPDQSPPRSSGSQRTSQTPPSLDEAESSPGGRTPLEDDGSNRARKRRYLISCIYLFAFIHLLRALLTAEPLIPIFKRRVVSLRGPSNHGEALTTFW